MPDTIRPRSLREQYNLEGQEVYDFHTKFLVPMAPEPCWLDEQTFQFRLKFMQEELDEFLEAYTKKDMHSAADSLVDLVYVALGTALMMGIPWDDIWHAVQTANMAKQRAKPDGSDSKRGSPLDVIKPEGWTPPDHTFALGVGPWPIFDVTSISETTTTIIKAQPSIELVYDEVTGSYKEKS